MAFNIVFYEKIVYLPGMTLLKINARLLIKVLKRKRILNYCRFHS